MPYIGPQSTKCSSSQRTHVFHEPLTSRRPDMLSNENATASTAHLVTGLVQDPDGRGTLNIVWSCLAVLLLNTWTVLHLNISPYRGWWRRCLHKVKWWIVCLICPDGLAVSSFEQWRSARESVTRMRKLYPWWTKTHGFYAEMGGFRVKVDSSAGDSQQYIFRVKELAWLKDNNIVDLPETTSRELSDRSKADWVAKSIAFAQSVWFMFQVLARVSHGLPITTLELATVAFISCTALMYFFWWDKPMDLETFTTVAVPELKTAQLCRLANATCFDVDKKSHWYRPPPKEGHDYGWDWFWFEKPMRLQSLSVINKGDQVPLELRAAVRNNFSAQARVVDWYMPAVNESHSSEWGMLSHLTVFLIGATFNGIHCAAWFFTFPTHIEALLWRLAVCTMLAVITLWVPGSALIAWLDDRSRLKSMPYWLATFCYFLARMYLLVEVLVGMRALEPKVYKTVDWTKYWPHI